MARLARLDNPGVLNHIICVSYLLMDVPLLSFNSLFGMAIYIAVKCPNFSTGCFSNASKTTTKTVPKTVRNGLKIVQEHSKLDFWPL